MSAKPIAVLRMFRKREQVDGPTLSFSHGAIKAIGVGLMRFGTGRILGFVVFIVLAHRISPADLGTFVAALAMVEVVRFAARGGLGRSLHRAAVITPELADTVFWGNLALSLLAALVCLALCHPFSAMMDIPQAASIIAMLGFTAPLSAAGTPHMIQALRQSGQSARLLCSTGAGVAGALFALAAIWADAGVWALVVQRFVSEAVASLVAWRLFRWRPGRRFDRTVLRKAWWLGPDFAGSQLASAVLDRGQDMLLGLAIGPGAIGIYRAAGRTVEMAAMGAIAPFCAVAPSCSSRAEHDPPAFRDRYMRQVAGGAMVALPVIAGLGVVADTLVPLLFGRQWGECAALIRILCLLGPPFVIRFFAEPAPPRTRMTAFAVKLVLFELALSLALCGLAVSHGPNWFAAAYVSQAYLALVLRLFLLQRETGIRAMEVVRGLLPAVSASLVMAIVAWGTGDTMPVEGSTHGLVVAARIMFLLVQGFLVYIAVLIAVLGILRRADMLKLLRSLKVLRMQ